MEPIGLYCLHEDAPQLGAAELTGLVLFTEEDIRPKDLEVQEELNSGLLVLCSSSEFPPNSEGYQEMFKNKLETKMKKEGLEEVKGFNITQEQEGVGQLNFATDKPWRPSNLDGMELTVALKALRCKLGIKTLLGGVEVPPDSFESLLIGKGSAVLLLLDFVRE